jgi:hypothetical protein
MHLQFHPKSSRSRTNVGLFLVADDRGVDAFVDTLTVNGPGSFRSQLNVVSAYIEPSCGPSGENRVGFLHCQTCASRLASICPCVVGIAAALAAQVNAA